MKKILGMLMAVILGASACRADPTWDKLQEQFRKALGPEWTIAEDLNSFVAVRKDAKLLGRISRVDAILGGDPWDRAIQSDYTISIVLRPKLDDGEYRELEQLRAGLIARRTKGLDPASKEAFGRRAAAEDAIELPVYFFGKFAVYIRCTAERFHDVRPESIAKARAEFIQILDANCRKYSNAKDIGDQGRQSR